MGHDIYAYRRTTKADRDALPAYHMGSYQTLERMVEAVRQEKGEDDEVYKKGLQQIADYHKTSQKFDFEIGYIGGHGEKIKAFYEAVGKPDYYVTISGIG